MAKHLKRAFGIGLLTAAAYALWRTAESRRRVATLDWEAQPFPFPPRPAPRAETEVAEAAWVAPVDGNCPDGYPVKAKLASGIFHVPGGANYDRTLADRCYRDASAAEADGLRAAKR
ncbi:MAG: hypothetical protein U0V73_06440 [Acidimicrobiia bacterium]